MANLSALAQIREEMRDCAKNGDGDPESAHGVADDLLIDALMEMVSDDDTLRIVKEIIEAYHKVPKWYA